MVMVAVYTARKFTSLRPHIIYDGSDNEFTDWLARYDVRIVRHRSIFREELEKLGKREGNSDIGPAISGAFLRVELPTLLEQSTAPARILYTDCDVMFRGDVVKELDTVNCEYFAVAPHALDQDPEIINSGVMLMNLRGLRKTADEFFEFIFKKLDTLKTEAWDQGAYRQFYREADGRPLWDSLPNELNWRPWWGDYTQAKIIHFHGPKPYQRDCIDSEWPELKSYTGGCYEELLDVWQELLDEVRARS
jgi:lipopolysaccharide biosynthesis glycosyltransferase